MPEFVRVFDEALKRKYSVPADAIVEDGLDVLKDEDAVDHNGEPLPVEFGVTKTGKESKSGQQAESKEK